MKSNYTLLLILLFVCSSVYAQESFFRSDKWMEYIEQLGEDTEDTRQVETLFSELSILVDNPFDINRAGVEELRKIPFFSDEQIENIIVYRERYGPLLSLYELKNIPALDFHTISLILPFVYVSGQAVENLPITVKNLLKRGRNELQIRYDRGFQQKRGYRDLPDSVLEQYPNRRYVGEPFYHSIRYDYSFDRRIQVGLVAEKDAGEAFWNGYHKGYDYYSFHYLQKNIGVLKTLALGDYKVSFGQGLVISNDFMPGRSAMVSQAARRTYGFRRHYSTNETDFFRGIGTTFRHKDMELSLFYSYRKMDAGVDSLTFTTLKTDGLHRTVGDWEKRRTVLLQTFGGNIRYATPNLCIGLTALSYSFGHYEIQPNPLPYNLYYFRGNRNWNLSVDYLWKNRFLAFYGETAISKNKALATLNALQLKPASYISFLLLYRYYDRRYQALFGNAFAQSGTVQNEQGIYMGIEVTPLPFWKLAAYTDFFRFPWLKYGIDAPSTGKEYMLQLTYTSPKGVDLYIRYKYKQKEKNHSGDENHTVIIPYNQQRLRMQCTYPIGALFRGKSSLDGVWYEENAGNKGFMIAQSIAYKPLEFPLQGDIYLAWFHTDDYNTRISSYERNLLYAFYMPTFYGRGLRLAVTFRWDILEPLSLSAKIGHTHYNDRNLIGTGLEEIDGANKTDLNVQVRWKF
ncbi:hypothetical protein M2137_002917 [Parabacteroides sp. PFB2-10]|uniref:ComEA family DNA-binding protein n=1 Tax=Parabacteroides sp. PFB2-10 TaxID=1742405 RepID=UPI002473E18B|nr:helix-hairpin-helix domain-containing protein [Parabacteroides sp. PFB2-10]MDH6314123.1 hypothetical protein [Parabacteroides sp. PFB2-10]MDL2245175.1 helix-hairpin-helix domain-containing protein [Parabacteroides sp. OttesenSCG-928-J18]